MATALTTSSSPTMNNNKNNLIEQGQREPLLLNNSVSDSSEGSESELSDSPGLITTPKLSLPPFSSIPQSLTPFYPPFTQFWSTHYMSPNVLRGFENYKYSSMDTSPLSNYVMHPFWNWVVKLCPRWIAPNLLTLTGFLFTVFNFVLLSYWDWDFTSANAGNIIPRWVWLVAALNLFLSHTLDGIDGKQARLTSTSSPLGELFDHGLDSWTTVFIPTGLYSVFGSDPTWSISVDRMYWCYWNVFFNFVLSHWEKYNTGILYLPWGYDASMVACFLVFLTTYFKGQLFWKFSFSLFGATFTSGNVVEFLLYAGSIGLSMPVAIWNVVRSYTHPTSTPHAKHLPFFSLMRPLYSPILLLILSTIWIWISSVPLATHPRIYFLTLGTIFSHICSTLIIAQMSTTTCEGWNWMLGPFALGLGLVGLGVGPTIEGWIIWGLCGMSVIGLVQFGGSVVSQMCDHFNIKCFKIDGSGTKKKPA